jgi:hypothetical protein
MDFGPMLDAVMATFGRPVSYLSPDEMIELPGLTGVIVRAGIPLGPGADDTGGIMQFRDVLRLRVSDFPDGVEPQQGALVTVDGERVQVTDVLTDPRGWCDLPLGGVDG